MSDVAPFFSLVYKGKMMETCIDFIQQSPTSWHACESMKKMLRKAHFQELDEKKPWNISSGKSYFVQRGASLAAFTLPKQKIEHSVFFTSHTDSPSLRLRPNADSEKEGHQLLHFEVYGAPILPSWLGRAVTLAGKVVVENKKGQIESKLVHLTEHPIVFPYVAYHLDRQVNDSFSVNKQQHLIALAGRGEEKIMQTLGELGTILHHELYCVPCSVPTMIDHSLMLSYRLDNLVSMFAAFEALTKCKGQQHRLIMSLAWNHEEIGSETQEGACSNFYEAIMARIFEKQQMTVEDTLCAQAASFALSVDVAHAWHPNFPEKSESQHPVMLGEGVVVKVNAQQRYMSDPDVTARVRQVLENKDVPYQLYSHRNDIGCGSTVGPIHAAISGVRTLDVGMPVLSMHAAEEIAHADDIQALVNTLKLSAEEVLL